MIHKALIIGAGLSGLTAAYFLKKKGIDPLILESRDRIGGRIHTLKTKTHNDLELGATWFNNGHKNLLALLDELELTYFEQYQKGESTLVFNTMHKPHLFETNPNDAPSFRIANGTKAIINKLSGFVEDSIVLNQKVIQIEQKEDCLEITTDTNNIYKAEHVISTLPPRLVADRITFTPQLDSDLVKAMHSTHTWMGDAMKVVVSYKKPFWRDLAKSGMVISQIGAVTEIYDHSNYQEDEFALMGFINQNLRNYSKEDRKVEIINYLSTYLGAHATNFIDYNEKCWFLDPDTSIQNPEGVSMHLQYGDSAFSKSYMNNRLLFSGTETSQHFGGYMEGAVISGIQIAKRFK